ncbi:MAG: SHOCT domain-containing protein [Thaumarchaeota archaeon]|nr:SHOCT domain-containing protein [Nitrososphaerota archaeon]
MLPIGLMVALVLIYVFAFRGGYFPGEFLFVLVAIFAVLFLVRILFWRSRRSYYRQRRQGNSAVRILRQRYARGEITKEQFRQMLRDLREGDDPGPDRPAA